MTPDVKYSIVKRTRDFASGVFMCWRNWCGSCFCVEKKMRRIVLIGPVYPYKGGISHYASLLYRSLAKKYDVEMISYKMQYPKFLFRKEQKDYSNDLFRIEDTKFWLHTANPFNIIRVGKKIRKMMPDMVILQWWHPYFAPCYWILCKVLGKKIHKIFICHNVFPHERFPIDRFLTKMTLRGGDSFILHSNTDVQDLLSIKKDAVYQFNPHPTYNAFKRGKYTKEQARKELGIMLETKVMLFFGFVREYKGLKYLLQAMTEIRERLDNVKLLVVGAFDNNKEEYIKLIQKESISDCVKIIDEYIPDNEVEKYFMVSDLVVLPYESATQSGIVQIAYGFEKPVIVTRVGGLPDVVIDGKMGYVVEPKNSKGLAEAVVNFYENEMEQIFVKGVKEEAYRFSWDRMVEKIESFIDNN